jgi:hypothetical protein
VTGRVGGVGVEALQDGEYEAGSLTRAGLRAREHVAAGQHGGNGLRLNGGRRVVALVGHGTQQFGREPEIGK